MLLAQNTGSKDLVFYSAEDIYIQKKKAGSLFVTEKMAAGSNSMINVKLAQYEYEDVVKEIKDISFKIEIRDENYNEIDTPTLEIKVK